MLGKKRGGNRFDEYPEMWGLFVGICALLLVLLAALMKV